jgi:hypothetical protein
MKAFWWQDGLHFEPETKEERKALALLLDSFRVTSIALSDESAVSACVLRDHGGEVVRADPKL